MTEQVGEEQEWQYELSGSREYREWDGELPVEPFLERWHCALEDFLDEWSNNPLRKCNLEFSCLLITRPMIHRLLPLLLNHESSSSPLHNRKENENSMDHDVHSPDATRKHTPALQFASFKFTDSPLFYHSYYETLSNYDSYVCTHDDTRSFLSALTRYPLSFNDAPEILSEFLTICEIDHFNSQSQSLDILQEEELSDSGYRTLGQLILRNGQLTKLDLQLPFVHAPCTFYDSLAKSTHIQKLRLCSTPKDLPKLICGDDGNGVVERLLRNSQSQLVELVLDDTCLEDLHLIALAQSLPTSQVKRFAFQCNNIHSQGLLEFARQIPKMKSLQWIVLGYNPWEEDSNLEECGEALLHGLTENTSMFWVEGLGPFPQCELLRHVLAVNFIRQKLLIFLPESQQPIPAGLWPLIMADTPWADPLHFLLRNCPAIFSYCNSS